MDLSSCGDGCVVEVLPTWEESLSLRAMASAAAGSWACEADEGGIVARCADGFAGRVFLLVPQSFHLEIMARSASVSVRDKLEGDCSVRLGRGSIRAEKLRGEHISLTTGSGDVVIGTLAEGGVTVEADRVSAAKLIGSAPRIMARGDVEVGSLYAPSPVVRSSGGSVVVHHGHGALLLDAARAVKATGVTGSLRARGASVVAHFDRMMGPGRSELVASGQGGGVAVTVSPPLDARVHLVGSAGVSIVNKLGETKDVEWKGQGEREVSARMVASEAASQSKVDASGGSGKVSRRSGEGVFNVETSFFASGPASQAQGGAGVELEARAASGRVSVEVLSWKESLMRRMQ